jgi:hypothetical protein
MSMEDGTRRKRQREKRRRRAIEYPSEPRRDFYRRSGRCDRCDICGRELPRYVHEGAAFERLVLRVRCGPCADAMDGRASCTATAVGAATMYWQ